MINSPAILPDAERRCRRGILLSKSSLREGGQPMISDNWHVKLPSRSLSRPLVATSNLVGSGDASILSGGCLMGATTAGVLSMSLWTVAMTTSTMSTNAWAISTSPWTVSIEPSMVSTGAWDVAIVPGHPLKPISVDAAGRVGFLRRGWGIRSLRQSRSLIWRRNFRGCHFVT